MNVGAERVKAIVASLQTFSRLDEASRLTVDLHEGLEDTLVILNSRLKVRAIALKFPWPSIMVTVPK